MKIIFVVLGFLFLALGVIGIYLPILPTTPFLLLAAACFARGSEKFNNWFINTSIYQKNIAPIVKKEGMKKDRKLKILMMISLLFLIGLFFMKNLHLRILLIVILLLHYYFIIFRVKTID